MKKHDVIVVGAGMAGLTCAVHLHRAGYEVVVLEASNGVGGRVRTDIVEGFRLDRGFQVLLTAYPETRSELDYRALQLQRFFKGALIRIDGSFHRVADPLSHPQILAPTLKAPIGSIRDRLRMVWLRLGLSRGTPDDVLLRPEMQTIDALRRRWHFSDQIIERLFRPLVGGMMLDPSLTGSSRMFEHVMRMLIDGSIALPSEGMAAIPDQLRMSLPPHVVRLNERVTQLDPTRVITERGNSYSARAIVLATEGPENDRLSGRHEGITWRSATCIYFVADRPPYDEPMILLNGEGRGPIMNLNVQTNVAPTYASDSRALIAVVPFEARPPGASIADIRQQLEEWFGNDVRRWRHLRTYHIPYALPETTAVLPVEREVRLRERLYVCGDHRNTPSINGAMTSGRHAAQAVAADLRRST